MSVEIGTNISYKGKLFLDQRQGVAKTESDLLNWSIPVPDGFEVYCDGKWYVYLSNYFSNTTGSFKLRIDNEVEDSDIQKEVNINKEDIQHLQDIVFPIEFKNIKGGGTFLEGSQKIPVITWTLYKDSEPVKADKVVSSYGGKIEYLQNGNYKYTGDTYLPNGVTVIQITVTINEIPEVLEVEYRLEPKKYLVLSDTKLTPTDWGDGEWISESSKYTIDCSGHETDGGVYIHYIIPKTYYTTNFLIHVGGLEMSDFDATESGEYIDICFNNKQNGLLQVSFENN